jgi:hypothetical protein
VSDRLAGWQQRQALVALPELEAIERKYLNT